jgi:adenine deaminase
MSETVDLLLRGTLVNVNTGMLEERPVAVDDGEIVALAERPAEQEIETGYIAPGLIDAHMHVESSMVTLPRYGAAVVPRGVTCVIHDPHEIANVLGPKGVRDVIADAAHTPLKVRFSIPSSVPASHLQQGGAVIDADAVADLLDAEGVVALGEVMNIPGVLAGDEEIRAKIAAARERGLTVDGHAPRVIGSDLQEVACSLDNDHESISIEEAREKVAAGLRVYLREGSSSKNLAELVGLTEEVDTRRLSLCTDDRDVVDLVERGGVDFAVEKAIREGVDPVETVQMATINTAESYGLSFGCIEPGAPADLVLLSDLETWEVEHVLVDGTLDPTVGAEEPPISKLSTDTIHFEPVDAAALAIEHDAPDPAKVRVIDAVGGLQTARMEAEVPVVSGSDAPDGTASVLGAVTDVDILPIAVIGRYGGGKIGRGFIHRLGLERGAVGSTVAHDTHNCVVAGADYKSMARVANHLRDIEGGVATYDPTTDETTSLALPVAGLMSNEPLPAVKERFEMVENAARELGLSHEGGLMELSFLALEVIPEYRLTTNGLVDVETFDYVDVVAGD